MTTSVRVQRRGGNKDVIVRVEHRQADGTWVPAGDSYNTSLTALGVEAERYVFDIQRLVIEEIGEFTS